MMKYFFILYIYIYTFQSIHTKKILIPFKTSHNTVINYIESLLYNQIYATLEIGTNKQVVYLGISTDEKLFAIESAYINEFNYNCNKSSSYKNNNRYLDIYTYQRYVKGDIINDTFYFYDSFNIKKDNIKAYNDIMFVYITKLGTYYFPEENGYIDNNKTLISGKIGLQITLGYEDNNHISILKSLKNLNLIDHLVWTINYTNNEEGYLILGENPYQYNDSYSKNHIKKTACTTTSSDRDFSWTFSFSDIIIGNNKLNKYRKADYTPQYGLIKGTSEYFELIKPYFEKLKKCELKEIIFKQIKYWYYQCDINVDINNFENITFIHNELEKKFILDKEDLFVNYNGKKYFLVLFQKEFEEQRWALGTPFVKKYLLTFDHESRNIFYYEYGNYKSKEPSSNYKITLICVCIILGVGAITLGIILGKIFVTERKKKKAKELVDELNNNDNNNEIKDGYINLGI